MKEKQRYELAFKASKEVIWDQDLITNQIFRSPNYNQLYNFPITYGNIYLGDIREYVHSEDIERVEKTIQQSIADPEIEYWSEEYRLYKYTGELTYVADRGYIVRDENKRAIRMVGAMQDITDRKVAEFELKENEEDLRIVLENPLLGIIWASRQGKMTYANNAICNMLGYSKDEIMNIHFEDFTHPEDLKRELVFIDKMFSGEIDNYQFEKRYITKSKEFIWVLLNLSCIRNEEGEIQKFNGVIQDINSRKLAEDELLKSEANLSTIFNNADTGYILLDSSFKILSFNARAQEFSKIEYKKMLAIGAYSKNYFTQEQQRVLEIKLRKSVENNIHNYEASFTQDDGSTRWYYTRFFRVRNSEDSFFGVIMSLSDITKQKISELEREKITNNLIRHNKDLEQFAFIISHDLRSPLSKIIGTTNLLSDILKSMDNQEKAGSFIKLLQKSTQKLDSVIRDLTQILQVKNGNSEEKEMVFLASLIEDIKLSFEQLSDEENFKLVYDFTPVDKIMTLKTYLYSIFQNLISNSIKYKHPDKPLLIEINSYKIDNKIILTLKDNGIGINLKENGEQIFGLYKRFHLDIEGKGLGLFMVKNQVEALNGEISAESEVNKGIQFTIEFEYIQPLMDNRKFL